MAILPGITKRTPDHAIGIQELKQDAEVLTPVCSPFAAEGHLTVTDLTLMAALPANVAFL